MYSFRDPKSLISETDESEPSHTSISYESEDSDMVESNTETGTCNASFVTKKKLKTPTPFSGKREDLQKFLQEVKIYLLANSGIYTSDLDKVLFVLSLDYLVGNLQGVDGPHHQGLLPIQCPKGHHI